MIKDKAIAKQIHKQLKRNVIDEEVCTHKQRRIARVGLVLGLWGPFLTALLICFLCSRGILGEDPQRAEKMAQYEKKQAAQQKTEKAKGEETLLQEIIDAEHRAVGEEHHSETESQPSPQSEPAQQPTE